MASLTTHIEADGMHFDDQYDNTVAVATPCNGDFCLVFSASDLLPEGMPHQIPNINMKTCEWLALAAAEHLVHTGH